jgi:serine/threonine-protein kinase
MTSSEWQRIEELFQAASQLQGPERSVYLTQECREDEKLRREVESLLEASESAESFIDQSAVSLGLKVLSSRGRQLVSGQSIGHYKIIRPLGSGGMGEVYLAEDCTLQRQVALKFLAGGLGDDKWAKDQLMKEARAVARLENSNICGVHGLEEIGPDNFIVMQYVEGETLASLLLHETPGLDRALDFAEQTVDALAAAHLHGIIHRDIKPQNMIVTPEGRIKVLDFGLAKFVLQNRGLGKQRSGMDQTAQLGLVMGTIAYMSPEQIRGAELDGRSDIFSFGIVLYEMLSGCNPFVRDSNEETLRAIQEQEPAPLPRGVSEDLVSIVRRCLAKNRTERFETTEDLLVALRAARERRRPTAAGYFQTFRRHRHFSKYVVAALALFICVLAAAGFLYAKVSRVRTLAVVPITNLSADSNLDYLSVGLTRNLYDKFSYLPRLKVRVPTEVPSQQTEDLIRAGRELKVEAVLSGEILKQGELLLLRVRILNTADGTLRFEHTFNMDPTNMFALQDEITRQVAPAMGLWLIGRERNLLNRHQTENQEALNAYMHGRHYWSLKRDRNSIQAAIRFFDRAIELDPVFAKAYTGRADCYLLMSNVLYGPLSTKDAMDKARYDARQALEIDPSLPEAHTSMGSIRFKYDWQWQQAEEEFKRAIELDPEYAPAHYEYANLLAVLKRFDEAIKQSEIAKELDPYSPLADMNYGRALYYAGRYDAAALHFQKLLQQKPGYPQFLYLMGLVLLQQRKYQEGIDLFERLHAIDPLFAAAPLGYAYGKDGRITDAEGVLRELDEFSKEKPITSQEKAFVYIGLGKKDQALALLEQAYSERFANLVYLTTDPLFDDLRDEPGFSELAHRMSLSL